MFADLARRMAEAAGATSRVCAGRIFPAAGLGLGQPRLSRRYGNRRSWLSQSITRTMEQGKKPDPLVAELMSKLFDPRAWFSSLGGMDEALQRMAEGPRLADLWDTERKLLNVFNAWTAVRRRSIEHNTVMLEAWMRAAGAFAKTLNDKADRKEPLGSWREVLALWVETANQLCSKRSVRRNTSTASGKSSRRAPICASGAAGVGRLLQRGRSGIPTRAELDDVHRTVTELRRELRALERANREATTRKARERRRKPTKPIEARTGA